MKLKIVSEGTGLTTRVVNAETGEDIEGVISVEWGVHATESAWVTLTLRGVPVEVVAETT